MRKNVLLASVITVLLSHGAYAHHGGDHTPPVIPTLGGGAHGEPPVVMPPVLAAPSPVAMPLVVAPPPVAAPAPVAVTHTFTMPLTATPSTILPTDVAGLMQTNPTVTSLKQGTSLTKEEIAVLTARDPRYQFAGDFISFSAEYQSRPKHREDLNSAKVHQSGAYNASIEFVEKHHLQGTEPAFLPTLGAQFNKISNDQLNLQDGAVLVRAGNRPALVSVTVKDQKILTRVFGGSLCMISAFDGKCTVLNLTDKSSGAIVVYVPGDEKGSVRPVQMKAGQIAEVYGLDGKPTSNIVATKVDINQRVGGTCGLLVTQCHYIRALRKFNLAPCMAKSDLDRVLKTAAAFAYVRRTSK